MVAIPVRKQKRMIIVVILVSVCIVAGLLIYENLFGFAGPRTSGAAAPTLEVAARQQVVYRIEPLQSNVRYTVEERFAGQPVSTAVGTTQQLAGDVLIDWDDFSRSQVGTIVINVEQFESDSGLRDRRIRREYLESTTYPEAIFAPREIVGLPSEAAEGSSYTFEMIGDLTVKATTQTVTWTVTAALNGDTLTGAAHTTILMSDFGIGPINIAGLVETSDDVRLDFEFVAIAQASD